MSWRRLRRKGKGGTVILALLIIGVLAGSYGFYHLFITTHYPTGHEVGTKINDFTTTWYGQQVHWEQIVQDPEYWDSDNYYSASSCQFDADPPRDRNPDVFAQVGQPAHGIFDGAEFHPETDNSKYTDQIIRDFWNPELTRVERHIFDRHYYLFTVDIDTVADSNEKSGSPDHWWAETAWTEEKASDDNYRGKEQDTPLKFELFIGIKAKPWDYSVNPLVEGLEEYSIENAQVWTGILSIKVENDWAWTDQYIRQEDGTIVVNPNDPVVKYQHGINEEGWYVLGQPQVSTITGKNLFLDPNIDWDSLPYVTGRPQLPQEVQVGGVGIKDTFAGLAGDIEFEIGDDDIRNIHVYNCHARYEILVEVLSDHGFWLSAPVDTSTEPPAREDLPPPPAPRPAKPWDFAYNWFQTRWGEFKGAAGFVGDIFSGIIDIFKYLFMAVIIIIIAIVILVILVFAKAALGGRRKRRQA